MTGLDVAIVLVFVAYCVGSGLRARAAAGRNLEEYFLAGRSLRGWQAGLSMAATQFAADTPLVVTGLVATAGVFALWRLWIYALAFLLLGFVLGASWRRAGVITDAELTELRYGSRGAALLRAVKAIYLGTVFNCVVLGMVLVAATRIAEPFLTWHAWLPDGIYAPCRSLVEAIGVPLTIVPGDPSSWPADVWIRSTDNLISILAIVTVTTFYSTTGGLRSVVATDVVQFAIMLVASVVFAWIVVAHVGGLGALPAGLDRLEAAGALAGRTPDQVLAFTPAGAADVGFAYLGVLALQWLAQMNADGTGYLPQRTMACRSDRDARQAALIFTVAQVLVRSLIWLPLAVGLLVAFPPDAGHGLLTAEREATYVRGIVDLLPPGVQGLMLTAMLAALASTVDTHLNWGASYWSNDIYGRFVCRSWRHREPSPRAQVWVARLANLGILTLALIVMMNLSSIREAWESSLLLGAGLGGLLVLRWLWWRVTALGELATIATSLVLLPILDRAVADPSLRFLVMAGTATAAGILASLLGGPEPDDRLCEFYRRTRPPGFWGPIARACGDDPAAPRRRLARSLLAVALAGLSLFSLLVAAGTLLVGSPSPLGPRSLWITALLVAGLALVPLWWRLAFREPPESVAPPV